MLKNPQNVSYICVKNGFLWAISPFQNKKLILVYKKLCLRTNKLLMLENTLKRAAKTTHKSYFDAFTNTFKGTVISR